MTSWVCGQCTFCCMYQLRICVSITVTPKITSLLHHMYHTIWLGLWFGTGLNERNAVHLSQSIDILLSYNHCALLTYFQCSLHTIYLTIRHPTCYSSNWIQYSVSHLQLLYLCFCSKMQGHRHELTSGEGSFILRGRPAQEACGINHIHSLNYSNCSM